MNSLDFINTNLDSAGMSLETVLWWVFAVVLVIYALASFALYYHWRRYGMKTKRIIVAETVYFVVSVGMIIVAALALILM